MVSDSLPVIIKTGPVRGFGCAVAPARVNNSPTVTGFPEVDAKANKAGSKDPGAKKSV